jgi:hypothetical protein
LQLFQLRIVVHELANEPGDIGFVHGHGNTPVGDGKPALILSPSRIMPGIAAQSLL